jgi:hypothetical protein
MARRAWEFVADDARTRRLRIIMLVVVLIFVLSTFAVLIR